jgi:hypothetical protein
MAAISSLNGGLLVGADHVLSLSEGLVFPPTLVEVQHSRGFLGEVRIAREDPRAVLKRADGILAEPSPDGGARDLGQKAPINRFPRHFPGAPAAQRNPIGGWQLTSQRFHLHPRFGGKRGAVCRSGACPPVHPSPPRKSAFSHLHAVWGVVSSRAAISLLEVPSAANSTILARTTSQ